MRIEVLSETFSSLQFNAFASHPLQTWEWGEARKKMGLTIVRFGEFVLKDLKKVYQMSLHPIPKTPFSVGYIPRSPYPSRDFIQFIQEYGKKNNIVFIKFEPDLLKSKIPPAIERSEKISPHPLFPSWTQVLELTKSEENLLKEMKSKTRYNIRLAQKKGVYVKEMSDDNGFKIFSKLYFETCKRQGYRGHNLQYHSVVWNTLRNKMSHILIAFYENTPLAAYELFFFKNTLYYTYGGTSTEYKQLMAANLLMWETIKLGKKLGANTLDMWGSLGPGYDQKNDWAGFTRFKEGYGTVFIEFCDSFDIVCNSLLYQTYTIAYRIRKLLL